MTVKELVDFLSLDIVDPEAKISVDGEAKPIQIYYNPELKIVSFTTGCDDLNNLVWEDGAFPVYKCDPEKNTNCKGRFKKDWCGIVCKCTTNKEFEKVSTKRYPWGELIEEDDDDSNAIASACSDTTDSNNTSMEVGKQRNN